MSSEKISHITDIAAFDAFVKGNGTAVVDFWAEWCPPCKALAPILDEIAEELGDAVKIAKVDIESAPELASKNGVRSIPTLLIFKGGVLVEKSVGLISKPEVLAKIQP